MIKSIYSIKRNSKLIGKWILTFLLSIIMICFSLFPSYAIAENTNRVVRVGFFAFEGYHETDEHNQRSGYGYEYLHEMAKYTDWEFEYVDGTWEECQEMLKNGEIDLLTSAQYSEARDEVFDFSSTSMGTSYAQLTVSSDNTSLRRNDYPQFNGIRIGLLQGNSRNDRLAEFAVEKGFTYTPVMYNTQEELENALKTKEVDAVLTSSLRKLKNESIIAQFAPSPFYAIVKEGNTELLAEVNMALEAIEMNNPALKYNLYQEFYRNDSDNTFELTREEKEYLETNPKIRAVIRPDVAPISYWENGEFKGISADLMKYLLEDLNIEIEYIATDSLAESYEMLQNGQVDIACLFESDYNLAEKYRMRITSSYLETNYSLLSRQNTNPNAQENQTIAIVAGGMTEANYVESHYPNALQVPVKSTGDAIKAVANGEADFALVNVYSAEKALVTYQNLRASFINDEEQQFAIGISQTVDPRLFSILDKKINSINSQTFNDILSRHTMFQQSPMTLANYFRQHPIEFMAVSVTVFAVIIGILVYIVIINRRHAKKMFDLAYVDKLTNLWNINGFLYHGKSLLSKNSKDNYVVAAIDLSNFSSINEEYGRDVGDKVLEGLGGILNRFNNDQTIVAHNDADHYLMLINYKDQDDINTTLMAIIKMISAYTIENLILQFHAFIGVGFVQQQNDALLHAIDHAGIARNNCSIDRPIVYMDKELQSRIAREKEIRDHVESGLSNGEFQVYYQPKVDMSTKRIIGAEGLIRWNHSKLGFLNPAEFLPIIEQSGLITEIDFFVLEQACKLIRKWIDAGQEPIIISVNQSRTHFLKSNYIERLQNMIIKYNIPTNFIELEITETLFGQETISNEIIRKIKNIGLLISIDDFGSGYSSLHLLHQISVDILKIDKGLLDESDKEEKVRNIIHRVVQIATDLNVEVICEGVETREQMEFLLGIDCKYAQGFLFSKPLPQAEFELLIQKGLWLE
ncbi:MAG: EAL domain-containing protein [Anaerorhabdus sp.]|uniref:EAL domain-containing protein n=1 Tax=Anaerorhabdus sp. TaxID=1872524 RepID=UPI002FCC060A